MVRSKAAASFSRLRRTGCTSAVERKDARERPDADVALGAFDAADVSAV